MVEGAAIGAPVVSILVPHGGMVPFMPMDTHSGGYQGRSPGRAPRFGRGGQPTTAATIFRSCASASACSAGVVVRGRCTWPAGTDRPERSRNRVLR